MTIVFAIRKTENTGQWAQKASCKKSKAFKQVKNDSGLEARDNTPIRDGRRRPDIADKSL